MVFCTDCKNFRITTLLEGDYCDAINEILDDNMVFDDSPCDFYIEDTYVRMGRNNSEN